MLLRARWLTAGVFLVGLAVPRDGLANPQTPVYTAAFPDARTDDNGFLAGDGKRYFDVDPDADDYQNDTYERPTVQTYEVRALPGGGERFGAGEYFGHLDIEEARAGFDAQFLYVAIDLASRDVHKDDGSDVTVGLTARYGFRLSTDPNGAGGFLFTADQPELKNVPNTTFASEGVFGFADLDGDVGGQGLAVTKQDAESEVSGNGYEAEIIADGRVGSGQTVLFVRIDPADPTVVELALDFAAIGLTEADLADLPYLEFEAVRGGADPQGYLWNDAYDQGEAGSPYRATSGDLSKSAFGTQGLGNVAELDTARGGPIAPNAPPTIRIDAPEDGALLSATPVSVSGPFTGSAVTVDVNGTPATVVDGTFLASLDLADGVHLLTATAANAAGTAGDAVTVAVDTTAPVVTITAPADGSLVNASPLEVSGTVDDPGVVAVAVNGVVAPVSGGSFSAGVPLQAGANTLTASATDAAGNTGSASVGVILDTQAPALTITGPADGTLTTLSLINVAGTVADPNGIAGVAANGVPAVVTGGAFDVTVPLALGANAIVATATDLAGNTASAGVLVTRGTVPAIAIGSPADGALLGGSPVTVTGTVSGSPPPVVDVNGVAATVSGGTFSAQVPLVEGASTLTATATNVFGAAGDAVTVTLDTTTPQVTITSPADGTETPDAQVAVSGSVSDASAITGVDVNGVSASVSGGVFSVTVPLAPGGNAITATATDAAGNTGSDAISVTRLACSPGSTVSCYTGPAGTEGVGVCATGVATCLPDGSGFGGCDGQVLPGAELCNGLDDSCDGAVDEGFGVGTACDTGELGICAAGTTVCRDGGALCVPDASPQPEVCDDGVDQDCDGADCTILPISIDAPASDTVTAADEIAVAGTVGPNVTSVEVNGVAVPIMGAGFDAFVPLVPGPNLLVAIAFDAGGNTGSDSVMVTRDATAPRLKIESPPDGFVAAEDLVTVTGALLDSVDGGIAPIVTVNGIQGTVQNGFFMVVDVPLIPGPNPIVAVARDAVGNQGSDEIEVVRAFSAGGRLERLSGDGQFGLVDTVLPEPLTVRVVDGAGNPLFGRLVRFEVVRNSGLLEPSAGPPGRIVRVPTNAAGVARASLRLGARSGEGNNRVRVSVPGIDGQVEFCASGLPGVPARVDAGAEAVQKGVISRPLPGPLEVQVVDADLNPVPGVPVEFAITLGGGHLDGLASRTVLTDADGTARANLTLGPTAGLNGNVVEATVLGFATLPAVFVATGIAPGTVADTTFAGLVLDAGDNPIPGTTVTISSTGASAATDADGRFVLTNVPPGAIVLQVDPSTSPRPETFPLLEFRALAIAGYENRLPVGPIKLPELEGGGAVVGGSDVVVAMPDVAGVELTVFAGSATFADGSTTGVVSIDQVHMDEVPMVPPMGMVFLPTWTVQPAGVRFDPPARIQVPNTEGNPPGAIVDMYSFDHDLNRFVKIGPGTVTEDGLSVVSAPGFGIDHAGWGGAAARPPTSNNKGPPCPVPDSQPPVDGGTVVPPPDKDQGDNHGDGRYSEDGEFREQNGQPRPHFGVDVAAGEGTSVSSVGDGTVSSVRDSSSGFGKSVVVQHGNGSISIYAHLSETSVNEGDPVSAGDEVGKSGTSGNAEGTTAPHLHFEIRDPSAFDNPSSGKCSAQSNPGKACPDPTSCVTGDC